MTAVIDWNPVLIAFIAFLGVAVPGLFAFLLAIRKTVNKSHDILNYQSLLLARTHAATARQLAIITKKKHHIEEADKADLAVADKEKQQAMVDGKA